jgi:predicted transcriptional regulator
MITVYVDTVNVHQDMVKMYVDMVNIYQDIVNVSYVSYMFKVPINMIKVFLYMEQFSIDMV